MSTKHTFGNEASVDEQTREHVEGDSEVAETPELRPSVEQEIQAKVDYADERAVKKRLFGQTLEAEERMRAREREIRRTHERWDRRQDSDREARCRRTIERMSAQRRYEFEKRAASVDPWLDPDAVDPREQLSGEELGAVNRQTMRLAERLDGWSRAAISRRLAERVVDGADIPSAVTDVFEELLTAPGQVIPIAKVGGVRRREVSIQGTVTTLWTPSHYRISQVGLIEDETGRIKFTSWRASGKPMVEEGEIVRLGNVAKNWYEGRCSVALTGRSTVEFPDRERQGE